MKRGALILMTLVLAATSALAAPTTGVPDVPDAVANLGMALAGILLLPLVLKNLGVNLRMGLLMATTISTTALQTAYGTEYANGSKSLNDLRTQLFESAEFDKLFTIDYTDLTTWEKAVSEAGPTTQAFQLAFTPNGQHTFTPSKFPLWDIKVDQKFSSHSVKREFIGFMHKNNVPQNAQQFVRFIINEHILPQHIEDVELYGAFHGVHVTPIPGTAGAVGAMMDGFKKYRNDAITAGTIVPIAVGAFPTDPEDAVEYVEDFVKSIPNTDKRTPMTLAMSLTNEEVLMEGMRIKYNTYYKDADVKRVYIRPNIMFSGQAAMGDSDIMFCSPKRNLIKAVNMGSGPLFNWETEDRSIKVWADYLLAFGIWNHKRFYTNDVGTAENPS